MVYAVSMFIRREKFEQMERELRCATSARKELEALIADKYTKIPCARCHTLFSTQQNTKYCYNCAFAIQNGKVEPK